MMITKNVDINRYVNRLVVGRHVGGKVGQLWTEDNYVDRYIDKIGR